jgi:hypothetical protein
MDTNSFEGLTRAVGRTTSRREALAILAGAAVAAVLPDLVGRSSTARAAEAGRATAAGAISCNDLNIVASADCTDLALYIIQCGVVCPDGDRKRNWSGCTSFDASPVPSYGEVTLYEGLFSPWCARQTVSINWRVDLNDSTSITMIPPPACCQAECNAEIARWEGAVRVHEQGHRDYNWGLIAQANADWAGKIITGCGETQSDARNALRLAVHNRIWQAADEIQQASLAYEPADPGDPVNCLKCNPGGACSSCVNGSCRTCNGQCCPTPSSPANCCGPGWTCCGSGRGCCDPGWHCCSDWGCCRNDSYCCEGGSCCLYSARFDADGGTARSSPRRPSSDTKRT